MARTTSAEPRKRPRQRRSAQTVERILDAAARIFDDRGYRGTTTNHVAREAGVSIGSLYQYFPNKDALLVGLADRHLGDVADRFGERVAQLRQDQPPVDEAVRSLVELAVEVNDTSRLHATVFSDCPRTPAIVERFEAFRDLLVDEVAWYLQRTGNPVVDPRLGARFVVAMVDAAVHEVVLSVPSGPRRRAATDELVALVVGGLGAETNAR